MTPRKGPAPRLRIPIHGHPNRGFLYYRTRFDVLEKNLAEQWEKQMSPQPGVNGGRDILSCILVQPDPFLRWEPTDRDCVVAASVVQWLGTNCGFGFLQECFQKSGYAIVGNCEHRHSVRQSQEPLVSAIAEALEDIDFARRCEHREKEARQMLFDLCEPS